MTSQAVTESCANTFTKGKGALGKGRSVPKPDQHFVEAIMSELLQKPLDVGTRQTMVCMESETGIFYQNCMTQMEKIWRLRRIGLCTLQHSSNPSTAPGPFTCAAAIRHFSLAMSSTSPCLGNEKKSEKPSQKHQTSTQNQNCRSQT